MAQKVTRCTRCNRRARNLATAEDTWNVVLEQGRVVGVICPTCQTVEENAEAEINAATLEYTGADDGGAFRARPKLTDG